MKKKIYKNKIFLIITLVIISIIWIFYNILTHSSPFYIPFVFSNSEETIARKVGRFNLDCVITWEECSVEQVWENDKEQVLPHLRNILLSKKYSYEIRDRTFSILYQLNDKEFVSPLYSIAKDENDDLRLRSEAIKRMGEFKYEPAKDFVLNTFIEHGNEDKNLGYASYEALLKYNPDPKFASSLMDLFENNSTIEKQKYRIIWILHDNYGKLPNPYRQRLFLIAANTIRDTKNDAYIIRAALDTLIVNYQSEGVSIIPELKKLLDYKNPEIDQYDYPYNVEREIQFTSALILSKIYNKCNMEFTYNEISNDYYEEFDDGKIYPQNDECIEMMKNVKV